MNAADLRELLALGIAGEALVRVAEIIDEASATVLGQSMDKSSDNRGGPLESTAEIDRKKRDRIRKKAERAAVKLLKMSSDTSKDTSKDGPLSASDVLTSLSSEESLQESKKETVRVRARGTRLMPGTPLSEEHRALMVAEGINDPVKLWAEFVDYWSDIPGQRGVKIRWTGTLRNRCRDVIKRGFNGHGISNHRADPAAGRATAREVEQVAAMGGAALRYLQEGKSAGPGREAPDGGGTAEVVDFGKRAENAR